MSKFHRRLTRTRLIAGAFAALVLSGCGGGGGGSDDASAPRSAGLSSIVADPAPGTSYPAGSEEAAAFALLNAERSHCGFGTVAQNAQLDTAARGHADYQLSNHVSSHGQTPGRPGFTGESSLDRVIAAGYRSPTAVYDLNTTVFGSSELAGRGRASVRLLLSAPYHVTGMLSPTREIGISIRGSDQVNSTATHGPRTVEQYDLALRAGLTPQLPGAADVLTYPCAGTSGTATSLRSETPNPVPGRDLSSNPIGQPVLVTIRQGRDLVIRSTSVKEVGTDGLVGAAVALLPTLSAGNDPAHILGKHEAIILVDRPLRPATSYLVEVAGTNNGDAFERSFTFTTGDGSH